MAKIKLTKGELKQQRDSLKQFRHYLPTLQLKKQQLQMKILDVRRQLAEKENNYNAVVNKIESWCGILADPEINPGMPDKEPSQTSSKETSKGSAQDLSAERKAFYLQEWIVPQKVSLDQTNVAGADIPVFQGVRFKEGEYDLYATPFWVDQGIKNLKEMFSLKVEMDVMKEQERILKAELKITTQRVNLFEKVKIPECLEAIRRIRIYLGDLQANAVGIGKVAKKKIEERELAFSG